VRPLLILCVCAVPLEAQTCNYIVTPLVIAADPAEQTGTIRVMATPGSCEWVAESNTEWISVSFGGRPGNPSTGNGTSGYRILRNRDASPRSGSITVAGQRVIINQAAADCPFTLDPPNAIVSPAGATGSFRVQTSCNWTASSRVDWIRVTGGASGSGNGTVQYSVAANNTRANRNGSIQAGPRDFQISQPSRSAP
jgi:hypothetical protein